LGTHVGAHECAHGRQVPDQQFGQGVSVAASGQLGEAQGIVRHRR
jgi:hypothetical protein